MEMPIVTIRHMFLGQAGRVGGDFTLSVLFTFAVLATGVLAFNKAEKTFVDIA